MAKPKWEYRIVHKKGETPDLNEFYIADVFFNADGDPEDGGGMTSLRHQTVEALREDFAKMRVAFTKPVLDYDTFEPIDPTAL